MSKSNYESLQHVFLIAMPQLNDPHFAQAVVYLWEYNEEGATGIIINKPLDIHLGELLKQLNIPVSDEHINEMHVLHGGPVTPEQGYIIRRRQKSKDKAGQSMVEITVSSTKQDLIDLAHGEGTEDTLVALGCACWTAGQLDKELANNDWLIAPFNEATLFGHDDESGTTSTIRKWYLAAATAGIDLSRLSTDAGHS